MKLTGETLASFRFLPSPAADERRLMTTGVPGEGVLDDTLANLLNGASHLLDTINAEIDRLVVVDYTAAALAELARRDAHPCTCDEACPPSEPACERWLDESAARPVAS